ncbi:MAG: serine protease [Bacteriovoracia bacterium]
MVRVTLWLFTLIAVSANVTSASDGRARLPEGVVKAQRATVSLIVEKRESDQTVEAGACTGFLVGRQLVLTNQHCVSHAPQQSLRIRVLVRDPGLDASGNPPPEGVRPRELQTFLAPQILLESATEDLALLRLEEPVAIRGVDPIAIATAGALPKHPWKISSTFDPRYLAEARVGYAPTIDLEACSAIDEEGVNWILSGCTARPGNSGSPLVNDAGEAVAILKSIQQELPAVVVRGTEYVVGAVSAVFATPMTFFSKAVPTHTQVYEQYLGQMQVEPHNYKSVGHVLTRWPDPVFKEEPVKKKKSDRKPSSFCPYDPRRPECVRTHVCPQNLAVPGPHGFFSPRGMTWPQVSSGDGYVDHLVQFYGDELYQSSVLVEGMAVCPDVMKQVGSLLRESVRKESDLRKEFLAKVRFDGGYRYEKTLFGYKLWTPGGYQESTGLSISIGGGGHGRYEQYDPSERKVFPSERISRMHQELTVRWIRMFREAFETLGRPQQAELYRVLVKSLSGSGMSPAGEAGKTLGEIERLVPPQVSAAARMRVFEALATDFKSMGGPRAFFGDPDVKDFLALFVLDSAERAWQQIETQARGCRTDSLRLALRPLRLLEEAILSVKRRSSWQRQAPARSRLGAFVESDHWLVSADPVEPYRRILSVIRDCPRPYALVKELYLAYEESRVAVDLDFYFSLQQLGAEAYQKDVSDAPVAGASP